MDLLERKVDEEISEIVERCRNNFGELHLDSIRADLLVNWLRSMEKHIVEQRTTLTKLIRCMEKK